jgi:3-dehydroquinate synthase
MTVIPPADITVDDYMQFMAADKKAEQGRIRFVLLRALGEAEVTGEVDQSVLQATLEAGVNLCCR